MQPTPPLNRTADVAGCELAYSSDGQGPRVLFIQGTGLHGAGWGPQVAALKADYTCAWFDNRGMGNSVPAGSGPITVAQMATDTVAVLDALGWPTAHIVGHSLGGCISLELALTHPRRVLSLALLCTGANGKALAQFDGPTIWRGMRMQLGTLRSRRAAFLELVLTPEEHRSGDLDAYAQEMAPLFGHDLAVQPPVVMKQVGAMRNWNVSARLGEIRARTLVVGAEHDLIAKEPIVSALAQGIPHSEHVVIKDAAHGVTITQAQQINHLLQNHLAASAPAAPSAQS